MRRPLVWLTLSFCLGILFFSRLKISFWLVFSLAGIPLILGYFSFRKTLAFDIFLVCLVFFLGGTLLKNQEALPHCHILHHPSYKNGQLYRVKGIIASDPAVKNRYTSFIFSSREIQFDDLGRNCYGDILVYAKGRQNLHYGDELILNGDLRRPFGGHNAKQRSYADYLSRQGIYFIMQARPGSVIDLHKNKGRLPQRFAFWLKEKAQELIFKRVSPVSAGILDAMLLGEKKNVSPLIYNSMIKTGTVHILVVSGFNVGIVFFIIALFLKFIRLSRRLRILMAIPLLVIYCLLTGASTPVVRATVMGIIFMSAYLVKREPDIYNSCALAALFILGVNPKQLFDVGFQLSFASVIAIVYLYPKIKALLSVGALKIKPLKFLIEGCLISFSAWLGTAGFIAYYFKIFSPVTVLANIFLVPLAAVITLCGFSLLFVEVVCPPFAALFASSSEFLCALLIHINTLLIKLPYACFSW